MMVEGLLSPGGELRHLAVRPEMDPLAEPDALQEAQLLDVRFDALRSTVGVLLELRMALQLRETNTGVLVGYGVHDLRWSAGERSTKRTAWNIVGSRPRLERNLFRLDLEIWPDARLSLTVADAAFFAGDVPGMGKTPPDYGDDDEAVIHAGIAGWRSDFTPVQATFLDAPPLWP